MRSYPNNFAGFPRRERAPHTPNRRRAAGRPSPVAPARARLTPGPRCCLRCPWAPHPTPPAARGVRRKNPQALHLLRGISNRPCLVGKERQGCKGSWGGGGWGGMGTEGQGGGRSCFWEADMPNPCARLPIPQGRDPQSGPRHPDQLRRQSPSLDTYFCAQLTSAGLRLRSPSSHHGALHPPAGCSLAPWPWHPGGAAAPGLAVPGGTGLPARGPGGCGRGEA